MFKLTFPLLSKTSLYPKEVKSWYSCNPCFAPTCLYIVKGFEKPITIKKPNEKPMHFYDVSQAAEFTSISVFSLNRLLSGERKSCNGWFLADFDFSSSFYKNAKSIRKNTVNLQS